MAFGADELRVMGLDTTFSMLVVRIGLQKGICMLPAWFVALMPCCPFLLPRCPVAIKLALSTLLGDSPGARRAVAGALLPDTLQAYKRLTLDSMHA